MASVAADFVYADVSCIVGSAGPEFDLGLSDYTVAAFACVTSFGGSRTIFFTGAASTSQRGIWLYLTTTLCAAIVIEDGTRYVLTGTTALETGRWYHIALTIDRDGNAQLWLDGVAEGSPVDVSAKAGFDSTNENVLTLGQTGSGNRFNGGLCFVRIWKRALAADQLALQANVALGIPHARRYARLSTADKAGLVASWDEPPNPIDVTHPWLDLHGLNHLSFTANPIIGTGVRNGDMETWSSPTDAAMWTESLGGSSTVNRESSVVYAGSYSCRLAIDAQNGDAILRQTGVTTTGKRYAYSVVAKAAAGSPTLQVSTYPGGGAYHTLSTNWAVYTGQLTAASSAFQLQQGSAASNSIYLDNVTLTAAEILTTTGPELVTVRVPWQLFFQKEPGMASRGQPLTLQYVAWDTMANAGRPADGSSHTLCWLKDGAPAAPTNGPSEADPVNAPGVYTVVLTAAECTCHLGTLTGTSSTEGVVIIPVTITFEEFRIQPLAATVSAGEVIGSDVVAYQHGRLGPYRWEITDSTGQPVELSSAALAFVAYKPGKPDAPVFNLTSAAGALTVGGPNHNQVTLTADDTHTATAGTLAYVLWDKTTDAVVAVGALEIRPTPDAT